MKHPRRVLMSILAAVTLSASVGLTTPAHAATVTVDCSTSGTTSATDASVTVNFTNCTKFNWIWVGSTGAMTIVFNPGAITNAPPAGTPSMFLNSFGAGSATSFTATLGGPTARTATFTLTDGGSNTQTVTFNGTPGGGGGGGSAAGSAPAPIFQQFGMPQSLTCEAAAPASLNWAQVASGGWSQSWAQWMNGGLGGAVCTRTLVYSTLRGAWVVA